MERRRIKEELNLGSHHHAGNSRLDKKQHWSKLVTVIKLPSCFDAFIVFLGFFFCSEKLLEERKNAPAPVPDAATVQDNRILIKT